jgi:glycosyltransferase involved in cell wall biosynthesis
LSTSNKRLVAVSHACVRAINRAIYRQLADQGWEVEVVTAVALPREVDPIPAEPRDKADPPIRFLPITSLNPRTYRFRGLADLLSDINPTVVHLEVDPISRLALETGKWTRRNRVPLSCLSCENLPLNFSAIVQREGIQGIPSGLFKNLLNFRTRKLVDQVFTISDDGTRVFQELAYPRVDKIPLGFDPSYFRVDAIAREQRRRELGLEGIVFAYFGRFVPEKGVHLLLESLAAMKDSPWQLMLDQFEGNDAYSRQLQLQIEELGLGNRIRYVHAAHGEVAQYMNAADVVVLPSIATRKWKEQYGRVAPEAMACGKLTVVANSGALPELVGNFGLTFPEGDAKGLTIVLENIIRNSQLLDLGKQAADFSLKNLSIQSQAVLMGDIFDRLIHSYSAIHSGS